MKTININLRIPAPRLTRVWQVGALALVLGLLALSPSATGVAQVGTVFTVNTVADMMDDTLDGVCRWQI